MCSLQKELWRVSVGQDTNNKVVVVAVVVNTRVGFFSGGSPFAISISG